nr:MAG TPA: hypothetical protein [Caudoviricetes sp.]
MPRKSKYKTVTVFESFVAAAETLGDDAEKGRLYSAIMRYSLYGEEPALDGIAAAFFELMKPNIDKSNCRRNARINGTNEEQTGNKNGTNEEPCSGFALPKEEDEEEEEEGENPARGAGSHTPAHAHGEIPAGYPKSVEEVMAIAADPRCAVEITREQAEAYFLARDTADWIDAARRKIQPGKVYGDLRRWVMKDRQRDGGTAGAVSTAEAEFEELCRRNEAIRRNL